MRLDTKIQQIDNHNSGEAHFFLFFFLQYFDIIFNLAVYESKPNNYLSFHSDKGTSFFSH